MNDVAFIDAVWREGLAPEPQITVSQWADQHRRLPSTSAEPGRWRTARTPYLAEMMDALSVSSPVERVVIMKGAQLGGTEVGLNFLGYTIHNAPGIALLVMPSVDMVKRNTRTRIDPMIDATPELSERIAPARARDSGNTMSQKDFPGGSLVMTGANSAAALRSTPARYLVLDEIDAYPPDVDGEGDPVELAIQRTMTYGGRKKVLLISTPTIKGLSRIEAAYAETDQRQFFVPCPHCGHMEPITWKRVVWRKGNRKNAELKCSNCPMAITEGHKASMIAGGEWRATKPGDGKSVGFHISALYSPFTTWGRLAVDYGRVHKDPIRLKTFVNTALGETWEDQSGEMIAGRELDKRREVIGDRLPDGVAVLTAGVDVQDDRLEAQLIGWGRDEESWILQHAVLRGDPSAKHVWNDLEEWLNQRYAHPRAVPDLAISAACIDTGGHNTSSVYDFVGPRLRRRIWGIKGRGGPGVAPWPRNPLKGLKRSATVFMIGVDSFKFDLHGRLKISEPGPGYIHLASTLPADFTEQLTSERVVTKYSKGRPVQSWVLRSDRPRNEALDCFVYGSAALAGLKSAGLRLNTQADNISAHRLASEKTGPGAPHEVSRSIKSRWLSR